jgi:hypothetical protein
MTTHAVSNADFKCDQELSRHALASRLSFAEVSWKADQSFREGCPSLSGDTAGISVPKKPGYLETRSVPKVTHSYCPS